MVVSMLYLLWSDSKRKEHRRQTEEEEKLLRPPSPVFARPQVWVYCLFGLSRFLMCLTACG